MLNKIKKELGIWGFSIFDFLEGFENLNTPTYDSTPQDLVEWAEKVRWLKGVPFRLDGREYLLDIYRDKSQEINIVKARQMELTEFGLNWLYYNLIMHPYATGLYMSDRQSHVEIFSQRLRNAVKESPSLKSLVVPGKSSLSRQPFKNGSVLYMYSAWGDFGAARSIPVDFAVVDEMQSVNVAALPVLKETLSKSKYGKLVKIGTGSDEGDEWWNEWHRGTQFYWDAENLKWQKTPNTDEIENIQSYRLNQRMAKWISEEKIAHKLKAYSPRTFINEVEGWWFKGMRKPILEKEMRILFDRNIGFTPSEEVDHTMPLYMGIDWGGGTQAFTVPWIWQLTNPRAPRFELLYTTKITERSTEKQADMMINLIDKYDVDRVVIDEGGGARQVEKLSKQYGDRVIKCHFRPRPGDPFEKISGENRVNVDRTWMIESIIDLIQRPEETKDFDFPIPRIHIPARNLEDVEWLLDHFTCIEAESIETGTGTHTKYTHPEETNDDALMACGYSLMAWLYDKDSEWFWKRIGSGI
ncbi:MAG: phage terminase large subunit family protein [Nitrosotalea sp.]